MIVVGIDPGVTGAIACVDSHGTCAVEDLPVIEMGGAGRREAWNRAGLNEMDALADTIMRLDRT